jgi:hypothetical protein
MNFADPIFQGYIFSETYNSLDDTTSQIGGLALSEFVSPSEIQVGGTRPEMAERIQKLSVPAGLVIIKEPVPNKIVYRKTDPLCDVIPDKIFDELVHRITESEKPKSTYSRKRRSSKPLGKKITLRKMPKPKK